MLYIGLNNLNNVTFYLSIYHYYLSIYLFCDLGNGSSPLVNLANNFYSKFLGPCWLPVLLMMYGYLSISWLKNCHCSPFPLFFGGGGREAIASHGSIGVRI